MIFVNLYILSVSEKPYIGYYIALPILPILHILSILLAAATGQPAGNDAVVQASQLARMRLGRGGE